MKRPRPAADQRALLTDVARLIVDEGYDLPSALKRAARAQAVNLQQACPRREAIWSAIREYRALFRPEQSELLQQQRRLAIQVMQTLADFRPRLLGSLVRGDGPLDRIQLLVFADSPEPVIWHLNDRHIPWQAGDALLHYSAGRRLARPALRFLAGETSIELIILSDQSASDPPRDPVSSGALDMRDIDEVRTLIDAEIA